jgi:hypothetical protein
MGNKDNAQIKRELEALEENRKVGFLDYISKNRLLETN